MPSSAQSISAGRQAATTVSHVILSAAKDLIAACHGHEILHCAQDDRSRFLPRRSVARLACRGRPGKFYFHLSEVILDNQPSVCFDAPSSRDPPMSKSLAFATASHPARHAAASPCDVPRGIAVGYQPPAILLSHPTGPLPPSPRKATTGNVGNVANLIFLRHPRAHRQKGSGKCGNSLRCRFYRCFCGAVAGRLPLAETFCNGPWRVNPLSALIRSPGSCFCTESAQGPLPDGVR